MWSSPSFKPLHRCMPGTSSSLHTECLISELLHHSPSSSHHHSPTTNRLFSLSSQVLPPFSKERVGSMLSERIMSSTRTAGICVHVQLFFIFKNPPLLHSPSSPGEIALLWKPPYETRNVLGDCWWICVVCDIGSWETHSQSPPCPSLP